MEKNEMTKDELLREIEQQASENSFVLFFEKPFVYEGKTYEKLAFDFSSLTGNDFIAIENELLAHNRILISPRFSTEFLAIMCAKACEEKVGEDLLRALPIRKFEQMRNAARNFLNS